MDPTAVVPNVVDSGGAIQSLLSQQNLVVSAGIFIVILVAKQGIPEFFKTRAGQRILPILAPNLGILAAFLGFTEQPNTWQDKVLVGMLVGFFSSGIYKAGRTALLGKGITLPDLEDTEPTPVVASASATVAVVVPTGAIPEVVPPPVAATPVVAVPVAPTPDAATPVESPKKE